MQNYRVELDSFFGPLDLLLYLVRRHEIDLHDIPIAKLTEQYLAYLQKLKQINFDVVGEFLVMAATLLEIKSQMLLPLTGNHGEDEASSTEPLDPRYELVQQLLQYKQFKDAAMALEQRHAQWIARFARRPSWTEATTDESGQQDPTTTAPDFEIEDLHLLDLAQAFTRILESVGQGPSEHEVIADDTPISLHAEDIVDRLRREGAMTMQSIFVGRTNRIELIGLFLAMLELVSQKRLRVYQDRVADQIKLELRDPPKPGEGASELTEPDWRDAQTGEIQYEWPSDEIRERVEHRARQRAQRLSKGDFDTEEDEVIDVDEEEES